MITQEYLVSDLELRLSKSKPSNETDVTYEQMAYWVDEARDFVTKQYVDEAKNIDDSLVMKIEGLAPYEVGTDVFIELNLIPLDIKKNRGVVYIENDSGEFLFNATAQSNRYLKSMAFTKPSGCTVVYSLNGSAIQLEGGDALMSSTYNVGLVHSELSRTKLPSDRYYLAPSTQKLILDLAEEIGLRELNGAAYYDITQDGKGNTTT